LWVSFNSFEISYQSTNFILGVGKNLALLQAEVSASGFGLANVQMCVDFSIHLRVSKTKIPSSLH
jgi:hypothetical protein